MKKKENKEKVLYKIHSCENLYIENATNVDVQAFSIFENEKEILFFPFSCFEITGIEKKEEEDYYLINLVYLGKYKKKIKSTEKIPESKFVKEVFKTTIIR